MKEMLRGLLGSKKAVVAILSTLAAGAARFGWNVDTETLAVILTPVIAYVLGQAHVDAAEAKSLSWQPKPTNGDTP